MNTKLQQLMDRSFTDEQGERFDAEKFANLIIDECAEISRNNETLSDDQGIAVTADIKNHFGIES